MSANDILVPKVIEYLSKKGYNRTEPMLRIEAANQDAEGKPIHTRVEDMGGEKYSIAFGEMACIPRLKWITDFF